MTESQRNTPAEDACCGPGYVAPEEAMRAGPEKLLYTAALHVGTGVEEPDYLATVDVDPNSETYSQMVHRTPIPNLGTSCATPAGTPAARATAKGAGPAAF